MTELISKDIVDLQDIEKIQFLQTLQSDPAKYSQYVTGKMNRIVDETIDTKRASFVKVSSDMANQMEMDHNSMATLLRSRDLKTTKDYILHQQEEMGAVAKEKEDLTRRQVEINNWYFENKRETLFVLQILLLSALVIVLLLAGGQQGFLSEPAMNYTISLVMLLGGGTLAYRWYYTKYIRDRRYWNRRMFDEDHKGGSKEHKICLDFGMDYPSDNTPAPANQPSPPKQ
jgi:hypothetical protein